MRTALEYGGKIALLAGVPLGYLGLCWWFEPPWWLVLASYVVCMRVLNSLVLVLVEHEVKKGRWVVVDGRNEQGRD